MNNLSFSHSHILQTLREEIGYSIEQLAKYLGTDSSTVQEWEDGTAKPTPAQSLVLSKLYGLDFPQFCDSLAVESFVPEDIQEEFSQEAWKNKLCRERRLL
ncbi:MAG: helix-turn-helix transcriptional regulator [Eubacteriales bacterium]|nr:helix-turn-helix transcriptional regulator [Eubacteriales bacterium]